MSLMNKVTNFMCEKCGCRIEDEKATKCPRCLSIIKCRMKCSECKGCSLNIFKKDK
ncbi:hypothetical protein [Anaeromicrobium sediminis]|uniref:hypothetical protein n=1 Tax=Anaeromicrobium sediminis TaxID=1478221 RepID=UPI001A9A5918|nr:hypothetical protein [Anaeromicrobium sediminis]